MAEQEEIAAERPAVSSSPYLRKSIRGEDELGAVPTSNRRKFIANLTFLGGLGLIGCSSKGRGGSLGSAMHETEKVGAIGAIKSVAGTSTYSFVSTGQKVIISGDEIVFEEVSLIGNFVAGVDLGTVKFVTPDPIRGKIVDEGAFTAVGIIHYSDRYNEQVVSAITIVGRVEGGVVVEMNCITEGNGLSAQGATAETGIC